MRRSRGATAVRLMAPAAPPANRLLQMLKALYCLTGPAAAVAPVAAAAAALAAAVAGVREAAAAVVEGAAACQAEVEAGGGLPAGHRGGDGEDTGGVFLDLDEQAKRVLHQCDR